MSEAKWNKTANIWSTLTSPICKASERQTASSPYKQYYPEAVTVAYINVTFLVGTIISTKIIRVKNTLWLRHYHWHLDPLSFWKRKSSFEQTVTNDHDLSSPKPSHYVGYTPTSRMMNHTSPLINFVTRKERNSSTLFLLGGIIKLLQTLSLSRPCILQAPTQAPNDSPTRWRHYIN